MIMIIFIILKWVSQPFQFTTINVLGLNSTVSNPKELKESIYIIVSPEKITNGMPSQGVRQFANIIVSFKRSQQHMLTLKQSQPILLINFYVIIIIIRGFSSAIFLTIYIAVTIVQQFKIKANYLALLNYLTTIKM